MDLEKIISLANEVAKPYIETAKAWKIAFAVVSFFLLISIAVNAYLATKNINISFVADDNIESNVKQNNG